LRVLIIEDEIAVRNDLKGLLRMRNDIQIVGETGSVNEAKILIKACNPDLVFLDIHLEDGTAFDILNAFEIVHFKLIFVTAYNDYAIKAIKLGALDYLLKPVDPDELFTALDRVGTYTSTSIQEQFQFVQNNHATKNEKVILRTAEGIHIVYFNEIVYCHSDGPYTHFHLIDNRNIIVSKTIKEYDTLLPNDIFARCHQSYLVNLQQIIKLDKEDFLILRNGMKVPVSSRKRDAIIQLITNHKTI